MRKLHIAEIFMVTGMAVALFLSCSHSTTQVASPDSGKAVLQLKVTPEDAVVILDDVLLGNAFNHPFIKLDTGPHKIEIRKEGYEPFRGTVEGGTTTQLEVNLKKREP